VFRTKQLTAALVVLALVSVPAFAGQAERKDFQVFKDVAKAVESYAWFTVFDDVNAGVDQGVVTLTGKVMMPFKRTDIERRVSKVAGVTRVINKIDVLPVSLFDDQLRFQIARAIYRNSAFWQYASMANPPIHVIVEGGRVTLTGVVSSNVEKMLARSLASFSGAFSVKSELLTDAEAKAALEARGFAS
jgi:hyperosmotically inducible protein